MSLTVQDKLDLANPNDTEAFLRKLYDKTKALGFGAMLAALRPRNRTLDSLTSADTHTHDECAMIFSVESPQGTPLAIISGGSPGAGEVSVDYDATTGVPVLEFNAAVTEYHISCSGPLPQTLAATMAEEI